LLLGKNQRRDDFILQVILAHAENNLSTDKVFFSENTKEFGNTNIQQVLANLGINYFSRMSNLEGWLNKQ
ncbi:MAG: hypothetical protein HGA42_05795, partial [Nostocales cyanobacterium W4_Combined_metabat2_030]|nr:hypothetical protein [Nostocales cyanobacterium W4_Combined_metabat2_030]